MILGLDLATKSTGWAIYNGELINSGALLSTTSLKGGLQDRIVSHLENIHGLIVESDIEVVVCEDIFIGQNNATGIQLGRLSGAIFKLAMDHKIPFYLLHNATIKSKFSGNGHAKKPQMIAKAKELFPELHIINDDHADAIATAYTYYHFPEKANRI